MAFIALSRRPWESPDTSSGPCRKETTVKKALFFLGMTVAALAASPAGAEPSGVSVWGEEAREVYNTLIAAGATRYEIPEGPTVIIDNLNCLQRTGEQVGADCRLEGDPKLSTVTGAIGLRLVKALLAVGVKMKTVDPHAFLVGVRSLECGILSYPADRSGGVHVTEMPSCYFIDNN